MKKMVALALAIAMLVSLASVASAASFGIPKMEQGYICV